MTFPIYSDKPFHTLLGSQNGEKRAFYSIFVVGGTNFWIIKLKFGFLAKMTKIVILDQKLVVPMIIYSFGYIMIGFYHFFKFQM